MITLIIKNYFAILFAITLGSILVFAFGLYLIFKFSPSRTINPTKVKKFPHKETSHPPKPSITITSQDINAIAGEDVLATQLDLARAYIETGRKQLAKKILQYVAEQGNAAQQKEAKQLLSYV